jgi:hypothetical protein
MIWPTTPQRLSELPFLRRFSHFPCPPSYLSYFLFSLLSVGALDVAESLDQADEGPWTWWWSASRQAWMYSPQVLRSHHGRWAWDDERAHEVYFLPPSAPR